MNTTQLLSDIRSSFAMSRELDRRAGIWLGSPFQDKSIDTLSYALILASRVVLAGFGFAFAFLMMFVLASLGEPRITTMAALGFGVLVLLVASSIYGFKLPFVAALIVEMGLLLPLTLIILSQGLHPDWILYIFVNSGAFGVPLGMLVALLVVEWVLQMIVKSFSGVEEAERKPPKPLTNPRFTKDTTRKIFLSLIAIFLMSSAVVIVTVFGRAFTVMTLAGCVVALSASLLAAMIPHFDYYWPKKNRRS